MTISTFIGLINNAALLVSLVLIYDVVVLRQPGEKASSKQIPIGLILGLIGLAIMKNPWEFLPGIIFDTRSILLSVCGLFFGTVPNVTATILTGGYRLYHGGVGAWTGFAVIVISGAVGLGWRYFITKDLNSISNKSLYLMGCVTHVLMLLFMLTLPRTEALGVLSKISLPVMLIFPVGTVLLGMLFINRRNRIKSEQLLKESEQRFQRAMNASQDGLYDWDLETKEIYYSPGWKRMLGYEPDELPNDFLIWEKLTHPVDVKASWTMMNEVVEGKRDRFEIEFRMKHKNGHWVDILSRSNLYKDDLNGRVRVVGTHVDISEIKKVERELKVREEEHGAILETAMDGFWIVDTAGRFLEVNETYCEMSGYAENELLRLDISAVEDVETAADTAAHMQKVMSEGQDRFESRHRRKDGSVFDVEVSVQYRPSDDPKCVVFIRDITYNKQIEAELQKFFLLAESSSEFIGMCDLDMNPLYVNPAGRRMVGLPDMTAACRVKVKDYYFPEDQRFIAEEFFPRVLREGHGDVEIRLRHFQTGEPIWVFYYLFSVLDASGSPVGWATVSHDITDRKRAEEEREKLQAQFLQAQKMESVGRLAGGVAHDYNNMLSVIQGYTELALEKIDTENPLHADLEEIHAAARRSIDITRQLLAFSRKQTIDPRFFDLNETVEGMLKMLRRLIGEDIDLAWHPGSRPWPVYMDPSQLDQILVNLCVNARDAIDDVGKITIETNTRIFDDAYCAEHEGFKPGAFVMIAVSDDGCGMDKQTQSHLFEPFFTTKKMGKGTGLGLATVYGIVKQNNGFINVYSESGQGTTFRIYLPRHESSEKEDKRIETVKPDARGNETILLVEDELTILRMTKMMLERLGYKVLTANKSVEAIDTVSGNSGKIHLMMTDVVMPDMNGRELASRLHEISPGLKILFMSGYTANVIAHRGVLDDGINFIQKPFSKQDLAVKVREALDSGET